MEGHIVKGEPEFTFCGAFQQSGKSISFKIENEIADSSNTWAQKDVLTYKGAKNEVGSLILKILSKRTKLEIKRIYHKTTVEEILKSNLLK
jgi:hypothetical protein